jgi:excisionase family DNA binding protein
MLLKLSEVAQILGIGRSLVYELIAQGQIPYVRLGRCIRVQRASLEEWIKANEISNQTKAKE